MVIHLEPVNSATNKWSSPTAPCVCTERNKWDAVRFVTSAWPVSNRTKTKHVWTPYRSQNYKEFTCVPLSYRYNTSVVKAEIQCCEDWSIIIFVAPVCSTAITPLIHMLQMVLLCILLNPGTKNVKCLKHILNIKVICLYVLYGVGHIPVCKSDPLFKNLINISFSKM
jgi:hypothetical protein